MDAVNRQIKETLRWLGAATDRYYVPLAAGVVGWLTGTPLVLQVLDWVGVESGSCPTLAASPLFVYGTRTLAGGLLFFVAWRNLA